jgi:ATP-binding cassette subfamily B protein
VSGRERRDAAAETLAAGIASRTELFGGKLHYDSGYNRHESAAAESSFVATFRRLPRLISRSFKLAWAADRAALVAVAVAQIGQGVAAAFGLLAANQVLIQLFAGGPTPDRVRAALPALAFVAGAGMVAVLLTAVTTAATGRLEPKVERTAEVELLRRVIRVEMTTIEDAEFKRLLQSARFGTDATRRMVSYSIAVVNALVALAAAGSVLAILHPLLLPMLLLIIVPEAWGTVRSARRRYRSVQAWLDHARGQGEIAWQLVQRGPAQEVRVHGAGEYLLDHYRRMAAASEAEQTRLARAQAGTDLATSALSGLATGATYVLLGWLLLSGRAELAASGTAVIAIRTGTMNLATLVRQVNQLYESSLFYLDLEEVCAEADRRAIPHGGVVIERFPDRVEVEGVTFTYPDRDKPALDDVTLTVERGQIVALVGENGSGKTTLAKLIAGLYRPDAGRITWDGVDLVAADRASVFEHVALVPQDFTQWPFTARANVTIGRPRSASPEEALDRAADYAETDRVVGDLPKGWDTLLDRGFTGGVQLSGGQWQRIVLARARFRDAPLLICDEPTAALDPRAEIEAFDRIRELARMGMTIVLITHRLASVRHADRIHVLDHGKLVEQGTHAELLAAGNLYAEFFGLQAAQYATEVVEPAP